MPLLKQFTLGHGRSRSSPSGARTDPEMLMTRKLALVLLLFLLAGVSCTRLAAADVPADHHAGRKVVKRVLPEYPEVARAAKIQGAVKLLVAVEPSGKVKSAKAVGGNPAFVQAALAVINKWKFEPAAQPSMETVEIKFEPE